MTQLKGFAERFAKWINDYYYEFLVIYTVFLVYESGVDESGTKLFCGFAVFLGVLRIIARWIVNRREAKRSAHTREFLKMKK